MEERLKMTMGSKTLVVVHGEGSQSATEAQSAAVEKRLGSWSC